MQCLSRLAYSTKNRKVLARLTLRMVALLSYISTHVLNPTIMKFRLTVLVYLERPARFVEPAWLLLMNPSFFFHVGLYHTRGILFSTRYIAERLEKTASHRTQPINIDLTMRIGEPFSLPRGSIELLLFTEVFYRASGDQ